MTKVRLGVPGLGIVEEEYDFNDPNSVEALDKNVANGCMILSMKHDEDKTPIQ